MLLACAHSRALAGARGRPRRAGRARPAALAPDVGGLRAAIVDLVETFGERYPKGQVYLARLDALTKQRAGDRAQALRELQREALLANPLLGFEGLLVVKRRIGRDAYRDLGIPANGSSNCEFTRRRYDNEIAVLSPVRPNGRLTTLHRPVEGGYVGEIDLHWDGDRLLFSKSNLRQWSIWEIRADGTGLRQVSKAPADVDCYDACYLPDGGIAFGCTAAYQSVPCFHGTMPACHIYRMDADGGAMRQLCFDQDLDVHATVLNTGQVLFNRWDYTGINHIYFRQLMAMNPDGTGQRAVYGSNAWFPNALYFPRAIPGHPGKIVSILAGYHVPRVGWLVVADLRRGGDGTTPLVRRISGRGQRLEPTLRDRLGASEWPKFLHPFPLSDKHFLVACQPDQRSSWGIYLADVFDNLVLLRQEPGHALLEPVPVIARPTPPVVPDRVEPGRTDAVVYLHNVYAGPGLAGVPKGTVKALRVVAYHFGYRQLAGPDKVGYGGPWEVMRILGTVPLEADGSAVFRVPARTPIAVQPLDAEGKAVQLMRSWFTAMPGEVLSCVGCHEAAKDAAPVPLAIAGRRPPRDIDPWYGSPRGFDFAREVQPVLDAHCVRCHDGSHKGRPDLRPERQGGRARAWPVGYAQRLHRTMKRWRPRFTPAYDALVRRIRRVGIEDDVSLLVPGEYHADTSPLVQMLRKGHGGVRLDAEAWDRLVTWIDLNAPCHGTWGDVFSPIPDGAHKRRIALRRLYGGPTGDPEAVPKTRSYKPPDAQPRGPAGRRGRDHVHPPDCAGWPFDQREAKRRQAALGASERTLDLGDGVRMRLVRIPAGDFVMGDADGAPDETPLTRVRIGEPLWMGACEVTNKQFQRFDPSHDPRYYIRRYTRPDGQGMPLNGARQPAVRVSWHRAMAFCRWLGERTGLRVSLPTEAQWEWACRAGAASPLAYGGVDAGFAPWANMGDRAFGAGRMLKGGRQQTGGLTHFVLEGAALADTRFDDRAVVTAPVGRYRPNAWGLHDMHGNAAEWTLTAYRPYPYREDDGRNAPAATGRKVVRGGSFFDSPRRCRSGFRLAYPAWQRVFHVGFRVVCRTAGPPSAR